MNLARMLGHRTGRSLALTRLAMVLLAGLWISLDQEQPVRGGALAYGLFALFVAYALAALALSWRSWWWDHRLAGPTLALDSLLFLSSLYFTEEPENDFLSPNIAYFAFLAMRAALRWPGKAAIRLTGLLGLSYLALAFVLVRQGLPLDLAVIVRRTSYLLILAWLIVWLAARRSEGPVAAPPLPDAGAALAHAMAALQARGGRLVWAEDEEPPRILASHHAALAASADREALAASEPPPPAMLFDCLRQRSLTLTPQGRLEAARGGAAGTIAAVQAAAPGLEQGLVFAISGKTGAGWIVLDTLAAPCPEDLVLARSLAETIARALDQAALEGRAREAALSRQRYAIARDLHDSVAQSLAGAAFRLSALRHQASDGRLEAAAIDAVIADLQREQAHVSAMIARLRARALPAQPVALAPALTDLADSLSRQWQCRVSVRTEPAALRVAPPLLLDLQQLLREAAANARRHGMAAHVTIRVTCQDDSLRVVVEDDGSGMAPGARPRSIADRVAERGGTLELDSRPGSTRLSVTMPLKEPS